jgi:hypothetical protein
MAPRKKKSPTASMGYVPMTICKFYSLVEDVGEREKGRAKGMRIGDIYSKGVYRIR